MIRKKAFAGLVLENTVKAITALGKYPEWEYDTLDLTQSLFSTQNENRICDFDPNHELETHEKANPQWIESREIRPKGVDDSHAAVIANDVRLSTMRQRLQEFLETCADDPLAGEVKELLKSLSVWSLREAPKTTSASRQLRS